MSTTTIRLPEELKARVAQAAKSAGASTHGFIVGAIEARVKQEELRRDFHGQAERRWREFLVTGEAVGWTEMREYMLGLSRGENPPAPKAHKLERKP